MKKIPTNAEKSPVNSKKSPMDSEKCLMDSEKSSPERGLLVTGCLGCWVDGVGLHPYMRASTYTSTYKSTYTLHAFTHAHS